MPSPAGPTPADRRPALVAVLLLITLLAWAYVVHVARTPGMGMSMEMPMDMPMDMPMPMSSGAEVAALFMMWVAMMAGMMLPAALPTILLFASMARQREVNGRPPLSVGAFVGGYLAIWTAFSGLAAILQARLGDALLDAAPHNRIAAIGSGVVLLLAGAYQWSAFKASCLSHCRSPLGHFSAHWREGRFGALRMGVEHGGVCLACCWLLMGLLFVGGVMNPLWVGGLCLVVLIEKVVPRGDLVGRVLGAGLVVWGVVLLAG